MNALDPLRSVISVSAARPDLVEKIRGKGADAILLDLEGGSSGELHRAALETLPDLVAMLRDDDAVILVRLTPGLEATNEVRMFAGLPVGAFVLPRAEDPQVVQSLAAIVRAGRQQTDAGIVPLIQTAKGVTQAAALGACDMRVMALAFDGDALAADLMIPPEPIGLQMPGQTVVLGARAAGRSAFGLPGPVERHSGADGFRIACIHGRSLGFSGVFCAHLPQVPIANTVFRASEDEVAWADGIQEILDQRVAGAAPPRPRGTADRPGGDRSRPPPDGEGAAVTGAEGEAAARPRIAITYCRQCNWLLRAAWMAQELLSTFGEELGEVALVPTTGGAFSIAVDGVLVWERVRDGGFPDIKTLKQRVRDAVAPDRGLGHVDR